MEAKKDYIVGIEGAERRMASHAGNIEVRAKEDNSSAVIGGLAARVNSETTIGGSYWGYREVIMPGAFDDVLKDDVRALFNHDPNYVLARTAADTLKIWADEEGLRYEYTTPDVQYAKDLAENIRLGNVSQSSFAFTIAEEAWEFDDTKPNNDLRKIIKFKRLYDVSPVTYPAYEDTEVGARSKQAHDAVLAKRHEAPQVDYRAQRERAMQLAGLK